MLIRYAMLDLLKGRIYQCITHEIDVRSHTNTRTRTHPRTHARVRIHA